MSKSDELWYLLPWVDTCLKGATSYRNVVYVEPVDGGKAYICRLCNGTKKMSWTKTVKHCHGSRHKANYMKLKTLQQQEQERKRKRGIQNEYERRTLELRLEYEEKDKQIKNEHSILRMEAERWNMGDFDQRVASLGHKSWKVQMYELMLQHMDTTCCESNFTIPVLWEDLWAWELGMNQLRLEKDNNVESQWIRSWQDLQQQEQQQEWEGELGNHDDHNRISRTKILKQYGFVSTSNRNSYDPKIAAIEDEGDDDDEDEDDDVFVSHIPHHHHQRIELEKWQSQMDDIYIRIMSTSTSKYSYKLNNIQMPPRIISSRRQIYKVLEKFELMEQLSLLELALWKANVIHSSSSHFVTEGWFSPSLKQIKRDYSILAADVNYQVDLEAFFTEMRITCGSEIIIPRVMEFLHHKDGTVVSKINESSF